MNHQTSEIVCFIHDSFVDKMESTFTQQLIESFGKSGSIVAEHFVILITSVMFGYLLCIFVRATKYRVPPNLRIRFSDQLNEILYLKIEKEQVIELVLRNPKTIFERIETYIAITMLRDIHKIEISERKIKTTAFIFFILLVLMTIAITIIILSIFNTAVPHKY